MSNLKEKLKELFPNHRLKDKWDFESQQFTAEDMLEFSRQCAEEVIKEASERVKMKMKSNLDELSMNDEWAEIDKQSILNIIQEL